jgi:EAL domain-containing protein (putative c-di-GMP-specific phosphodiesterase class I)
MASIQVKNFNLPWHLAANYWIVLFPTSGTFSATASKTLMDAGLQPTGNGGVSIKAGTKWKEKWESVFKALQQAGALAGIEVAVVGSESLPSEITDRRTAANIQAIAESLWLGEALLENRVMCYLQPVMSSKEKTFGYESFARVKMPDGSVVAGDKIMAASRALNIEFMIDRLLHVQAIHTFATSNFNGYLFVNFFPGFIHRPAVYLEGLSETAKQYGIFSKHIVLDFTRSETQRDMSHIKSVCDYCHAQGYSIALDDIESVEGAKKLVAEIRPDFVKIDMQLAHQAGDSGKRAQIKGIVDLTHAAGGTVIGEGIETEETYAHLRDLGVDLFQGYLFSPPVPVEVVAKKTAAG